MLAHKSDDDFDLALKYLDVFESGTAENNVDPTVLTAFAGRSDDPLPTKSTELKKIFAY